MNFITSPGIMAFIRFFGEIGEPEAAADFQREILSDPLRHGANHEKDKP